MRQKSLPSITGTKGCPSMTASVASTTGRGRMSGPGRWNEPANVARIHRRTCARRRPPGQSPSPSRRSAPGYVDQQLTLSDGEGEGEHSPSRRSARAAAQGPATLAGAGLVFLCHAALAARVEWESDALITRADLASPHRPR